MAAPFQPGSKSGPKAKKCPTCGGSMSPSGKCSGCGMMAGKCSCGKM